MCYEIRCFCLFKFFLCPCMAINVSVQYEGGLLPDIIMTVDPMLLPSGNPFKCHEDVLSLQSMIPPKRFDIFPPVWDALSLDAFSILLCYSTYESVRIEPSIIPYKSSCIYMCIFS